MDQTLHEHIYDETKADVWKKFENLFVRKPSRNKTTLIRRLVNLNSKDGMRPIWLSISVLFRVL